MNKGFLNTEFDGAQVLVVGGAGFVGSNLVRELLASVENISITIVDNLLSSEKFNVPSDKRIVFVEESINNDLVLSKIADSLGYIFHLATYHGNQSSIHDPLADHENNTLTTLKLFNHIRSFKNLRKVVYSSAGCAVAPKTFSESGPIDEDLPISLDQDSPYSISKIIGEFYSVYYHKQYGLPVVRARFHNVYGPGEILGAGKWRGTPATVWRNVTPTFIYKAIRKTPLPLENKGIATRDFVYVKDICIGLLLGALKGKPGDVYNLASGRETSIRELASLINELTRNEKGFEELPKRAWDSSGKRFGSTSKSRKELGFESKTLLEDGLRETVEWTRRNFEAIEECVEKHRIHMEEYDKQLNGRKLV